MKLLKSGKALHRNCAFGNATWLATSARQVDLEPSVAGVDRARSYSLWLRVTNTSRDQQNRIFGVAENTGNTSGMVFSMIPSSDNTGVGQKYRFRLITSPTDLIYIQSEHVQPRNRWQHIVVTYTGSEANTGFEMYINGIKESNPTRNLTGTYTGMANNSNFRFKVANHESTNSGTFAIRDFCAWDKALSDAEVTELYNDGYPVDITSVSFYANIVAHWPFTSDINCVNNATYNFSQTGSNTSFITSDLDPRDKRISFRRATDVNTRYVAFGGLVRKDANTVSWFGRSGTSHVLGGKIVRIDFDIATETASAPVDVITDGTYDLRGGSVGIDDNGHIHVFISRYNGGADTFIDTGMYTSTDGGDTFGGLEAFETTYSRYNFYGQHTKGDTAGEFFVPFFEHNGTDFLVSLFKTTDNWATHSKITVYSGTTQMTEPALINLGNGNMLIVARRNNSPYGLFAFLSTDGGDTWGSPTLTNLAGTGGPSNVEMIITKSGKLSAFMTDRSGAWITQSLSNRIDSRISNPANWVDTSNFVQSYATDSYPVLGYPSAYTLDDGRVLIVFSAEFSSSRADLYFGIGSLAS